MSLLEQDTTRKGQVDKPRSQLEFEDNSDGEEYKFEAIRHSAVFARESESGHLPGLYYLLKFRPLGSWVLKFQRKGGRSPDAYNVVDLCFFVHAHL